MTTNWPSQVRLWPARGSRADSARAVFFLRNRYLTPPGRFVSIGHRAAAYIGRRLGRWAAQDGRLVWSEVQYLCYIVKRYETGSAVFYIGKSYINPYGAILGGPAVHLGRVRNDDSERVRSPSRAPASSARRYIKWRARARVDMTDFTGLTSCSSTARHSKNTIQWPQCKIGASFPCSPSG